MREMAALLRYIAFAWDPADPQAAEFLMRLLRAQRTDAASWASVLASPGLIVHATGGRAGSSECYRLADDSGVILGKLFQGGREEPSQPAPTLLDAQRSARIGASGGRELIERYWGRYVALLRDGQGSIRVLRDPSALLPCYTLSRAGVHVIFSYMEDAARLGLAPFTIDFGYIAGALAVHRLQLNRTGLREVSQVLGGECLRLAPGVTSREFYWDPLKIARGEVIEDVAVATREMRRVTRDCVHAWAGCHESIVHTLSGGLDSSIVMACLADPKVSARVVCINYHSEGSDGDERSFARLSAQRAGVPLIERPRNAALDFEPLLKMARQDVPVTTFRYYLENHRAELQLACEYGASAIFSGNTGDQIFYQSYGSLGAGDYLARHGLRPQAFAVALDAARMDGLSVWSVLRSAVAHGLLGRRWRMNEEAGRLSTLLTPGVIAAVRADSKLTHPLFMQATGAPSGKLFHAHSLLFAPAIHNPLAGPDGPELTAPLYSQPLIELALRIPTYVLTRGGWERAIARRAFQHDIPREIAVRRTKGGVEEHARAILLHNLELVRELLSDGVLVREGILDRARLTEVLSGHPTRIASGNVELYECVSAEAWARSWCAAASQRAAA